MPYRQPFTLSIFFIAIFYLGGPMEATIKMLISSPFVSVRNKPIPFILDKEPDPELSQAMFGRYIDRFKQWLPPAQRDPIQSSQLLFSEQIICHQQIDDEWLFVELLEQDYFSKTKQDFKKVTGYIKQEHACPIQQFATPNIVVDEPWTSIQTTYNSILAPMGTKLYGTLSDDKTEYSVLLPDSSSGTIAASDVYFFAQPVTESIKAMRNHIISLSKKLIGTPFCWGGRTPYTETITTQPSGFDCSGLFNLIYRCCGLHIPRNSLSMFLKTTPIDGNQLEPGDLIFFAHAETPQKVNHVMMYGGDNLIIECNISQGVTINSDIVRLNKPINTIKYGEQLIISFRDMINEPIVYFGTFLSDKQSMQTLRQETYINYNELLKERESNQ